jgi:predicted ester cyclase
VPNAEHERVVRRPFDDLFTRGDLDAVDGLVAPDFVAHGQGGSEDAHGREPFREWLRWYTSAFTERAWTLHDVPSEGEKVVARNSGWVTYRGGLLGIPSEGQRALETGILILRIKDGLVRELWSEMSDLQVMMQPGAFPRPGQAEGDEPGS